MKKLKYIIMALITILISFSLFGCKTKRDEDTLIVSINDKKLYLDDFIYDIYLMEAQLATYDKYYKDTLKSEADYLDMEYEGKTMREQAKDTVLERVTMYAILSDLAEKNDITLTQAEQSENEASVNKFISDMSEEELTRLKLTKDILLKAYNRITLGDKYYQILMKDVTVDEEKIKASIDRDAYRQYKTEFLYITTISGFDEENKPISLSEDDIASNFELMKKANEMITEGKSMLEITEEIPEITYNTHDYIYGETTYRSPYQESSKDLDNDTYTDIIQTGYGFLIIHMLDNNSEDAYQQAITDAIKAEQDQQFSTKFEAIKKDYTITINQAYWDSIVIGDVTSGKEETK